MIHLSASFVNLFDQNGNILFKPELRLMCLVLNLKIPHLTLLLE